MWLRLFSALSEQPAVLRRTLRLLRGGRGCGGGDVVRLAGAGCRRGLPCGVPATRTLLLRLLLTFVLVLVLVLVLLLLLLLLRLPLLCCSLLISAPILPGRLAAADSHSMCSARCR